MKSTLQIIRILTALSCAAYASFTMFAGEMNYQGRLTDANGNPLADGGYVLTFRLFEDVTGGIAVWGPFITDGTTADGHTTNAQLVNGRFNVVLGPRDELGRELSQQFLGGNRYLEIQTSESASPISPRQRLLHAPLALHADTADHATTATAVGQPGSSNVINLVNDKVGINTATPGSSLNVHGTSNSDADAESGSAVGLLMLGDKDGAHLLMDGNEILARVKNLDGSYQGSALYLNDKGSDTQIRGNTISLQPGSTGGITFSGGPDNDGTVATLKIANSGFTMLLDSNEIDTIGDSLYLSRNSGNSVEIGNSSSPDNDGSTASLKVKSSSHTLLLDGDEIDSSGTLQLNTNSGNGIRIGTVPSGSTGGSRFNVNSLGYSNASSVIRGVPNDIIVTEFQNSAGTTLVQIIPSATGDVLRVFGEAAKNDGSSSWDSFSDRRLKKDIVSYEKGLDEILQLEPVRYRYKDNEELGLTSDKENVGVIAQDAQKPFSETISEDDNGYLSINVDAIHWASINAIKELSAKVDTLEEENVLLKKRLSILESQFDRYISAIEQQNSPQDSNSIVSNN